MVFYDESLKDLKFFFPWLYQKAVFKKFLILIFFIIDVSGMYVLSNLDQCAQGIKQQKQALLQLRAHRD